MASSRSDRGSLPMVDQNCEICGFGVTAAHRIKPGSWGGTYDASNVAYLCPNHHRGVHHLMKWYMDGFLKPVQKEAYLEKFNAELEIWYFDSPLNRFFFSVVKPVLVARLQFLGMWHPYQKGYVAA